MCPFIDESNPRCASHLSLRRLTEALGFCADHYEYCPIYKKLRACDHPQDGQPGPVGVAAG